MSPILVLVSRCLRPVGWMCCSGSFQPVESTLADKEFKSLPIKRIGIIHTIQVYPYLHKKHAELAPLLADTLKAMKADGTFDKLTEQAKKLVYGNQNAN